MKIAIVGAGMTGAYLYKLLVAKGYSVDIFDRNPGTRCGLTPCAWGTSRGFAELVKASGLDPSRYVLKRPDHVIIDELKIGADVMTIDKQMLIRDLLQDVDVNHSRPDARHYDRVIDATGVSRAFLPLIKDDFILPCVQFRVRSDGPLENRIRLGRIGYAWCFPLSGDEYHIGCGSPISDPRTILKALGWMGNDASRRKIVCACAGTIRLAGPQCSLPFVADGADHEIWGVGEAIGCVAPLAGDGIIPGMRSAQILMEHWDDASGYTRAILREFRWMQGERRVIDKLRRNEAFGLSDAWVLKKNSRRMAMEVGLKEAAMLLKHLR
ncbi:MAG TPA: NAD(P)-binding protein [Syntrophorhabdales bacterium]|nr:NAD(P)-binding protein [Syntrophorhabdales bacterium]